MVFRTLLVWAIVSGGAIRAAEDPSTPSVIPQPASTELREGSFTFDAKTTICVTDETRREGEYLAELLAPAMGFTPAVLELPSDQRKNCVVLRAVEDAGGLGTEGYRLSVTPERILAEGSTAAGVFYGCQTLRQLLPSAVESECLAGGVAWTVPCVEIEDTPRYPWRGIMLDPGHNFLAKEFVKHYLDVMALYKLNRLHLHLTDMGWAIEIKRYPELTNIRNWPPIAPRWRRVYGKCTQGFYTQDDVREMVAHAARRHIMVIPEVELPGHSSAALACYPEMICPNWKSPVEKIDSYFHYPINYCAGNEKSFEFLEGVLSEVIELFPGPYVHIGGDERVRGAWEACPRCQAKIKTEGLKDEDELQSYFVKRIEKFVQGKGRRIIGWSEIMEGGLASTATVQSWLDPKHAVTAAGQGHDVIMSTNQNCYLNYRGLSLEKAYSFEPTPPGLPPEAAKHILGVEPCLWGFGQHRHDELVFPRLCAFAEVGWSPKDHRDWDSFAARLKPHGRRLDELGINYRRESILADQP
jgi:hexosaminidase